jgi:hypothetical protein
MTAEPCFPLDLLLPALVTENTHKKQHILEFPRDTTGHTEVPDGLVFEVVSVWVIGNHQLMSLQMIRELSQDVAQQPFIEPFESPNRHETTFGTCHASPPIAPQEHPEARLDERILQNRVGQRLSLLPWKLFTTVCE